MHRLEEGTLKELLQLYVGSLEFQSSGDLPGVEVEWHGQRYLHFIVAPLKECSRNSASSMGQRDVLGPSRYWALITEEGSAGSGELANMSSRG